MKVFIFGLLGMIIGGLCDFAHDQMIIGFLLFGILGFLTDMFIDIIVKLLHFQNHRGAYIECIAKQMEGVREDNSTDYSGYSRKYSYEIDGKVYKKHITSGKADKLKDEIRIWYYKKNPKRIFSEVYCPTFNKFQIFLLYMTLILGIVSITYLFTRTLVFILPQL